jgi:hypothetical protein
MFLSRFVCTLDGFGQDIGMRHEMKLDFALVRNSLAIRTLAQKDLCR